MSIYTNHPLLPGHAHIRLLQMRSGSSHDEIHCTISTFDINTAPNYHALSYEWGPESPLQTIHIMGQPTKIRSNLFNFLSRLKARASYDYLWCDSICIDQANDHERSHQVQLMNRIYRKAKSVLVWLGEARDNSDFTLRTIRLISTCTDSARAAYLGDRPTVWQGLVDLSMRRYWTRIWIVQEITVARDAELFCGSEVIPWSTFASACRPTLYHDTLWSQELWTRLPGTYELYFASMDALHCSTVCDLIRSQRRWPTNKESFATLYERYKKSGCEDGRDRIFALLGISTEVTLKHGYTADYRKSKEETFFSLVAWAGKGAVKMDSRLQFARMAAEALELTWPQHQLEPSRESESQRSPSFFKWVRQPLKISLRCYGLGVWSFERQLETTGATIFRSASRAVEVFLPPDATEHDMRRALHIFEFDTSKVLLACRASAENSWTVVGRAYYAQEKTLPEQSMPSVFQGLNIRAGGLGVQLQNIAQFMEIFLEERKSTLLQQGKQPQSGCPQGAGSLLSKGIENRELDELLGKRRIRSLPNLDWSWGGGGGGGGATMVDKDSVSADLSKLKVPWDCLASSRIPPTCVSGPTPTTAYSRPTPTPKPDKEPTPTPTTFFMGSRKPDDGSSLCPPDISLFSWQSPIGHRLDAPQQYHDLDWRDGECLLGHGIK